MKKQKRKIIKNVSESENAAKKEIKKNFPLIKPFVFDDKQETPEQLKNKTLSLSYAWLDQKDPVKKGIHEVSSQNKDSFDDFSENNHSGTLRHRCEVYSLKSYNPQNISKAYQENLTMKSETLIQVPRISRVLLQRSRKGGF